MIIWKNAETVAIDNETTLAIRSNGYDGFSLETSDYEGIQIFTIPETETEVHELFVRLFEQITIQFVHSGYNRMEKLKHNPFRITLVSDSGLDNTVVIEQDPYSGDIVLTFANDPNNHYHNNRVILDIDGNLYGGYFAAFRELFEGLQQTPSKNLKITTRLRKFLPNKRK